VVLRRPGAGLDEAALVRFCRDNMAYHMVPRFVEFVDEMPRTMTQKVQKYRLQESAQARLGEVWDREKAGIVVKR
jgi:carnitine-CoA ligase